MAHISWRAEYSVNVKVIDDQHKHFFAILDEVYDSFSSIDSAREMRGIIEKLIEHVHVHFSTEEGYFDQFHCVEIDEVTHREKHREFTEQVLDLKRRYEDGQADLLADAAELMENWLIQHIMTYDKKYMACFAEHGLH